MRGEKKGGKRWWMLKDQRTDEMIHFDRKQEDMIVCALTFSFHGN